MTKAPKAGTDILLDLLSIGTPVPVEKSSSPSDLLSSTHDKSSVATLDVLSSPSLSAQAASPAGATPMMDLLDGFAPNPPKQSKNF